MVFVICARVMGWFMPPFAKIQTPWTDQEGKPYLSPVKDERF